MNKSVTSRFHVTFIHKDMSIVRLHCEKTGLETLEIFHYGTNMKASSALEMFWACTFSLASVQRTVGVENAERSGKLLLDVRPGNPNRREAQGAGGLLSVLVGAPT